MIRRVSLPDRPTFGQADGRGCGVRLDGGLIARQRMGGNIEAGSAPVRVSSLALVPFRNIWQRRHAGCSAESVRSARRQNIGLPQIPFALRGRTLLDG